MLNGMGDFCSLFALHLDEGVAGHAHELRQGRGSWIAGTPMSCAHKNTLISEDTPCTGSFEKSYIICYLAFVYEIRS
jgi:hypothetical protein